MDERNQPPARAWPKQNNILTAGGGNCFRPLFSANSHSHWNNRNSFRSAIVADQAATMPLEEASSVSAEVALNAIGTTAVTVCPVKPMPFTSKQRT